jgi:hypothetical protein
VRETRLQLGGDARRIGARAVDLVDDGALEGRAAWGHARAGGRR